MARYVLRGVSGETITEDDVRVILQRGRNVQQSGITILAEMSEGDASSLRERFAGRWIVEPETEYRPAENAPGWDGGR